MMLLLSLDPCWSYELSVAPHLNLSPASNSHFISAAALKYLLWEEMVFPVEFMQCRNRKSKQLTRRALWQ
jgi:hypothetical protein